MIISVIPTYKRFEIFLEHFKNLPEWLTPVYVLSDTDTDFNRYCVFFEKNDIDYCVWDNEPLSEKMNFGLKYAYLKYDFDYMMNLGSDDIVNPELLELYKPYMGEDFFGVGSVVFIDNGTKSGVHYDDYNEGRTIGAGRMIHRRVFDQFYLKSKNIYPDNQGSGLDTASANRIIEEGFKEVLVPTNWKHYIIDIKSNVNINPYIWVKDSNQEKKDVRYEDILPFS